jgi:hypothetical protein
MPVGATRSPAFLLRPHDDGVGHGSPDGEPGLIAQETHARQPVEQRYTRARRDAEREQIVRLALARSTRTSTTIA